MQQPWPSPSPADVKEQARPKLAQTLNSRGRSKLISLLQNSIHVLETSMIFNELIFYQLLFAKQIKYEPNRA